MRAYQVRGHHVAELDPLGILDTDLDNIRPAELELSHYGWSELDLDKQFALGPGILPHFATEERTSMTLREIIKTCRRIYCMLYAHDTIMCLYILKVALWAFNIYTSQTRINAIGSGSG